MGRISGGTAAASDSDLNDVRISQMNGKTMTKPVTVLQDVWLNER